jgi:hypothetical protein
MVGHLAGSCGAGGRDGLAGFVDLGDAVGVGERLADLLDGRRCLVGVPAGEQFERLLALTAGLSQIWSQMCGSWPWVMSAQMVRSASSMIWARDLVAQMLRVFIA